MKAEEAGQVFPLVAISLLVAVLLAGLLARAAVTIHDRTRAQTAVDATALSAATAYARGLNIVAASNQVLFGAAAADALLKIFGGWLGKAATVAAGSTPLSFTELVMQFQDIWAGTGGKAPGVAPLMMQAAGQTIGAQNGLKVVLLWNGRLESRGGMPHLNVHRASLAELFILLAVGPGGGGSGPTKIAFKRNRSTFSYQPRGGGPRVQVSPGQVEEVVFTRQGKTVKQYRLKQAGGKAGKFVKRGTKKISRVLDIPLPLIENSPDHQVLVIGHPSTGRQVVANAETGGGEVFNVLYGDPNYDARLIKVPAGYGRPNRLVRLLRSIPRRQLVVGVR